MKSRIIVSLFAAAVSVAVANPASGQVITGWSFDTTPYAAAVPGATGDTLTSNVGPISGSGYQIGFTNSIANPGTTATYTYTSVNAAGTYGNLTSTVDTTIHPYNSTSTVTSQTAQNDLLSTTGGTITENTWRVRSANTSANLGFGRAAPNNTQGTQWVTNTTGYSNIKFSFDWFSTNQAIRDMQVQYSIDGTSWTNVGTGTLLANPNTFYATTVPNILLNLPADAANESYLGVRLVAAYDSTGNTPDYAGATLTGGLTTPYNNNSGNWRLDNLEFLGTAPVPEPSTFALVGAFGIPALLQFRRRRAAAATAVK